MEQQDSVKGELQTLIMLEQQQNQTLDAIHSKGAFNPTVQQTGGFGFGASHYVPNMGGIQRIPVAGEYMNQIHNAMNFTQNIPGMEPLNNFAAKVRNATVNSRVESTNPLYANESKMSMEARELSGANLGEKMATGTLSGVSMLSGFAGSSIGSALGSGMIGSLVGGAVGGAAVGAFVDIGVDQMKQNFAYNKYLLQNSYRFINPFESNNDRNAAGFNRSERWDTANWLRKFNTKMKISDDDTMMLLQGFTEGDLLRDTSDVESFKKKMEQLTKSVKTMALSLNETYEEVVQTMADLKKAGLDTRDYKAIAGLGKITGSFTGQDAGNVVDYQTKLAKALANGTSLDINKTMSLVQGTESFLGYLYSEAEKNQDTDENARLLYNRINNRGGVEGATSDYLQISKEMLGTNGTQFNVAGAAFYDYKNGQWVFNKDRYEQYKNSDFNTIAKAGAANMQAAGKAGIAEWQSNAGNIMMGDFGSDVSSMADLFRTIVNAAKRTSGMEDWSTANVMENIFGIKGEDTKFMSQLTDEINNHPDIPGKINAMAFAQTAMDDVLSNRVGFGYELKNMWEGAKDTIGDLFSPIGRFFGWAGEGISDWWYGGTTDMNKLRERWGSMDWDNSPTKGLRDALAEYARVAQKTGYSGDNIYSELGIDKTSDITSRGVYSSIDKLAEALQGLADDVTSYAQVIRNAAEKSNVSEGVAAAAVKELGITDSTKAQEAIGKIGEYKQSGLTEENALRKYLEENGKPKEEVDKIINQVNQRGSEYFADDLEITTNDANYGKDETAEKLFGAKDNRRELAAAKVKDIDEDNIDNASIPAARMAAIFGINYDESEKNVIGHTKIKEEDLTRISQATMENMSETAVMFSNGDFNNLSAQEKYDRLYAFSQGASFLKNRGIDLSDDIKKAIEQNDDLKTLSKFSGIGVLSNLVPDDDITTNQVFVDTAKKYILDNDDIRQYYEEKKKTTNSRSETESFKDFIKNGAAGMYDTTLSEKIKKETEGMTVNEMKDYFSDKIDEAGGSNGDQGKRNREFEQARQKMLESVGNDINKRRELAQYLEDNGKSSAKEIKDKFGIDQGTAEDYVTKRNAVGANAEYLASLRNAYSVADNQEEDSEARADAYMMLGRAVGVSADKKKIIEKNLKNFNKMTPDQIDEVFKNAGDVISESMFGDFAGQKVTAENREAIGQQLVASLSSSGMFKQDQINDMVSYYINGTDNNGNQILKDGQTLDNDSMSKFVSAVMNNITNGTMTNEDTNLKSSMDSLKKSVDNATEAIKGTEGYKDKDADSGASYNVVLADTKDKSSGVVKGNNNGTSSSTNNNLDVSSRAQRFGTFSSAN